MTVALPPVVVTVMVPVRVAGVGRVEAGMMNRTVLITLRVVPTASRFP